MKHRNRLFAGLLSAAVLMQGAAVLPSARATEPLTAEAASVRSIQTRVFEYDFGGFQALYDNKTGRWFTTKGAPIVSRTEEVQRLENPYFNEETEDYVRFRAVIINMTDKTLSIEMPDGRTAGIDEIFDKEYGERFRDMVTSILEITPEYAPQYYDKAQQLYADVPEPAGFPLTYVWRFEKSADDSDEGGASAYCDIYFGENLYGICLCYGGKVTFTKAEDIAEEGSADPFTDEGDATLDGTQDVSDAVLTSRVVAETEGTNVSDLGMELADKDGDGLLTGGDITGILRDIAGITESQPDVIPEGAIPIIRLEYLRDDLDSIAKTFGYESGAALEDEIMHMNINYQTFAGCTEGTEYDVWNFAYHFDGGYWLDAAVRSMTLTGMGDLQIDALTYRDPDSEIKPTDWSTGWPTDWLNDPMRWIQLRVTVPHGALPQDTNPLFTVTEDADYFSAPEPLKYIAVEFLPEGAIPIGSLWLRDDGATDAMAMRFGYESFDAMWDDWNASGSAEQMLASCTEGARFDHWNLMYCDTRGKGFISSAIRSMHVDADGVLQIEAETYMPSYMPSPTFTGDAYIWVQFSVRHGALPQDLQTNWNITERDVRLDVPAVKYITTEPRAEGIRAEVSTQGNMQVGYEDIIPEDIDPELETPTQFAFRQYFAPEDTDSEDLQKILAQGKDVLAVYLQRPSGGSEFGVMQAELSGGTLNLSLAEHCDFDSTDALEYHRILLITEDGALPELSAVNAELAQEFHDTVIEVALADGGFTWIGVDTRSDFEAAICNPVYITVTPQSPQIALRGNQAGIGVRYCDTDSAPAELAIEPLVDDSIPDLHDPLSALSIKDILQTYINWQNGIPALKEGDLLTVVFREADWRGALGVQSAVLDSDGVLHLTVARCTEAALPIVLHDDGSGTRAVICMVGETGAFDAIHSVQMEYIDYESAAEYADAIPQYLSIQYV